MKSVTMPWFSTSSGAKKSKSGLTKLARGTAFLFSKSVTWFVIAGLAIGTSIFLVERGNHTNWPGLLGATFFLSAAIGLLIMNYKNPK